MNVTCFMMIFILIKFSGNILLNQQIHHVLILCDYNADTQSVSFFGSELIDFCDTNSLFY